MQRFIVKTKDKRQISDLTEPVAATIEEFYAGKTGVCHVSVLHTTAALTTSDLDPGTDLDMLDAFEHIVPKLHYRHPHNPTHVPDHILSALIGTSITIPVESGGLVLGTWQRIVLIEFDGPRSREIVVTFTAEG
jgi:secondary thiamine-phosphate synthase enzyme